MTYREIREYAHGRVRGVRIEHALSPVYFFGNLPYARAPFNENRFKPPQPIAPWAGMRDGTGFGPAAPQAPRVLDEATTVVGGEDCLTLNVWTPEGAVNLPVLVYLPGGGFMRGQASDPIYDGASFARQGLVFVSFNYRIGIDGFLQLDDVQDGEAPVNRGLLDQLAAIAWVQEHIAAFGGNPNQITLGGVSAGAGSIVHLLGMPALQGKIARAILQSPSITCQTVDEAAQSRRAIAALLGCPPTLAAIREQPLHRVVRAVARLLADYDLRRRYEMSERHFFPLRPVIDHSLVHADPLSHLRQGWCAAGVKPVDLLVGANESEMNFYLVPDGEIDRVTWARVEAFARATNLDASAWQADGHPGERLARLQSEYYYQRPARRLAALARECGAQSWEYWFRWPSPTYAGRMGAAHAMELPFVFNRLDTARGQEFVGTHAPQRLADEMHSAWAAFARGELPLSDWPTAGVKVFE